MPQGGIPGAVGAFCPERLRSVVYLPRQGLTGCFSFPALPVFIYVVFSAENTRLTRLKV